MAGAPPRRFPRCSHSDLPNWGSEPLARGRSRRTSPRSACWSGSTSSTSGGSGSVTFSTAARGTACCSTCSQASTRTCDMTVAETLQRQITTLFSDKLNVEVPSVETDLIETGLVDSLAFVEFLAHLETEFGIRVSLEDLELEHFRTIARIAGFIATTARARPTPHGC